MEIGKTRGGTTVQYMPNQSLERFKADFLNLVNCDKFDVYCMYQWLIVRFRPKRDAQPEEYNWWETRLTTIIDLIPEDCVEQGKLETDTPTSNKMVQFGKNMVNSFWR